MLTTCCAAMRRDDDLVDLAIGVQYDDAQQPKYQSGITDSAAGDVASIILSQTAHLTFAMSLQKVCKCARTVTG